MVISCQHMRKSRQAGHYSIEIYGFSGVVLYVFCNHWVSTSLQLTMYVVRNIKREILNTISSRPFFVRSTETTKGIDQRSSHHGARDELRAGWKSTKYFESAKQPHQMYNLPCSFRAPRSFSHLHIGLLILSILKEVLKLNISAVIKIGISIIRGA